MDQRRRFTICRAGTAIPEFTPETRIFPTDADLVRELRTLGWGAFFVKDYVKSLKTSVGSLIGEPEMIGQVIAEMQKDPRVRSRAGSRTPGRRAAARNRAWDLVLQGRPHGADLAENVPDVVRACAERIPSKFFSIDVALRRDGVLRVVEIGDGQVSDLVGWSPAALARIWTRAVS